MQEDKEHEQAGQRRKQCLAGVAQPMGEMRMIRHVVAFASRADQRGAGCGARRPGLGSQSRREIRVWNGPGTDR